MSSGIVPAPTSSVTFRTRHNFSAQHLRAARYFAGEAGLAETTAVQNPTEENRQVHRAYVAGAVVFAAAFLDASINEIVLEAADPGERAKFTALSDEHLAAIAEIQTFNPKILSKYRQALGLCDKEMDPATEPWLGTRALIELRNGLMHFKSEWNDNQVEHTDLEGLLNGRFPLTPLSLAPLSSLWFPHRCLGAGCAGWATRQAAEFMKEFCGHLEIDRALGK